MGENLFEVELTVEAFSELGNPLERLLGKVDFEMFRPILEGALLTKEVKSAAGRKPIDVVLMLRSIGIVRAKASTALTCLVLLNRIFFSVEIVRGMGKKL